MSIFRSRKFWLAVFAVAEIVVLHYFQVPEVVWGAITAVILWLIGTIAVEDAAKKRAGNL